MPSKAAEAKYVFVECQHCYWKWGTRTGKSSKSVRHPKSWRQPTGVIKSDCALKGKSISFSKRHLSCASSREYNKFCIITLRTMKDKAELTRVGCLSPELAEGHPACRNDTCNISESSKAYIQNYPNVQNLAPSPVLALYDTVGRKNSRYTGTFNILWLTIYYSIAYSSFTVDIFVPISGALGESFIWRAMSCTEDEWRDCRCLCCREQ